MINYPPRVEPLKVLLHCHFPKVSKMKVLVLIVEEIDALPDNLPAVIAFLIILYHLFFRALELFKRRLDLNVMALG